MTREHTETLAAIFDGERVDPAAVNRALANPEAPTLLAELAALRALAQADIGRPDEAFYAAMRPILRARRTGGWWRRFVQPAMAASLLLVGGLAGYALRPASVPRSPTIAAQSAREETTAAMPSGRHTPDRGQTAVTPGPGSPGPQGVAAAGPPPASLRLRFSQWQAHVSTAGGQPE